MTISVSGGVVGGVQNPQEITHEKSLVGCEDGAQGFVRTMSTFGDKLGPYSSSSRPVSRSKA